MNRRTKIGASIAAGATAVVAVAAIAVANPSASNGDDATPNPTSTSAPTGKDSGRTPETPLTGAAAEDATAAALDAVPGGTVLRVETDSDGGGVYEAHVRKADGTEVVVLMDNEFAVISVEEITGRGGHGPGGRGGPDETPLTGDKAEKATAAATAEVPGGTVLRVETDANDGATYEAHVRKADGTEVIVLMDEDFTVTSVEEFTGRGDHGPRGGGGHGPRGGHEDRDGSTSEDGTTATPTPSA